MLELDLEGSGGPSGGEPGKRMLFDNTKHSPSTEFSCKWSCGGSLEGFNAPDGAGGRNEGWRGRQEKEGPEPALWEEKQKGWT